jgi:hypothetical protein
MIRTAQTGRLAPMFLRCASFWTEVHAIFQSKLTNCPISANFVKWLAGTALIHSRQVAREHIKAWCNSNL